MTTLNVPPVGLPTPEDEILIRNERIKYVAAAFDRASTASFAAGWVTPVVAWSLDVGGVASSNRPVVLGAVAIGALAFALTLSHLGWRLLGGMRR